MLQRAWCWEKLELREGRGSRARNSSPAGEGVIRSWCGWEETGGAQRVVVGWVVRGWCRHPEEHVGTLAKVLVVTVKDIFFDHSILSMESLGFC